MKLIKIFKSNFIEIKCLTLKNLCMMSSLHHHNKSISFYSQKYVDKSSITNHLDSRDCLKRRKISGEKPCVEFNLSPMPPSKSNNNINKQVKSILKRKDQSQPRNTTTTKHLKTEAIRFTKRENTTKARRKSASIIIVSLFDCLLK